MLLTIDVKWKEYRIHERKAHHDCHTVSTEEQLPFLVKLTYYLSAVSVDVFVKEKIKVQSSL